MKNLLTIILLITSFIFAGCSSTGVTSWDEFKEYHSSPMSKSEIEDSRKLWGNNIPNEMEKFYNKKESQL